MDVFTLLSPQYLLVLAVTILTLFYLLSDNKRPRMPPGPTPWPLVGNLIQIARLKKPLYEVVSIYRKKYGDILRFRFGPSLNAVFIMGNEKIYKAAVTMNDKFKYRPTNLFIFNYMFNNNGLFLSNGEAHARLRKLTLGTMRDFGVGKRSLEERIQEEANMLTELLETDKGEPRVYVETYKMAVGNIIAGIVYGDRFSYDDPTFPKLLSQIDNFFKSLSLIDPVNFFPFLRFLPGSKLQSVINSFKVLEAFAKTRIEEHRASFDPDNPRDFVDIFLKNEHNESSSITEYNMFRVIVDLFNAGTDTTATAIAWTILLLTNNPAVQDKCRAEINEVVGCGRQIRLEDRENMPYLQAVINEMLRYATIAPQSAAHFTMEDVEFEGYVIQKNTLVFFYLNSMLRDKKAWGDPDVFRPERFLDEDGKLASKDELANFAPFSLGGRACLGKHLARMELFIFLGTLIQKFEFRLPPGSAPLSDTRIQTGVTSQPAPYKVCAVALPQ